MLLNLKISAVHTLMTLMQNTGQCRVLVSLTSMKNSQFVHNISPIAFKFSESGSILDLQKAVNNNVH